jgi:hypothetical protein
MIVRAEAVSACRFFFSVDLVHRLSLVWRFMLVNIHEAKTHFSRQLQRVAMEPEKKRPLGFARGEIWIADDFDAPLPHNLLAAFYGGEIPKVLSETKRPRRRRRK